MENIIVSSGQTSTGLTLTDNTMYVNAGGTATGTTVNSVGRLYVSSGGSATNTTVNSKGGMYVYDSGTANNIMVNSSGCFSVASGGTATGGTVNSGGWLIVSRGGLANNTTVNSSGCFSVDSGGTANSTTVNHWGQFSVSSGGTANDTIVNSGWVYISGTANSTTVNSGWGYIYGTANSATVNSGEFIVFGSANNIMLNSGRLFVEDTVNSATVNFGGEMEVFSGGTATGIIENGGCVTGNEAEVSFLKNSFSGLSLTSWASATVHSGTTANSTTVNNCGYLYVYSGGTANDTELSDCGYLNIYFGGSANNTVINNDGYVYISSGGTANDTTVNYLGKLNISSGGTANNTIVNSRGYVYVSNSGTANNTIVNSRGYVYVSSGGTAISTTVNSGDLSIASGGTANNTIVNSGGTVSVRSGGMANSTTINSGGWGQVSSGGMVTNIIVSSGARLSLDVAPDTYVQGAMDGNAFEMKDALLSGYTFDDISINVYSGGMVNSITANRGSFIHITNGGTANGTTLNIGWMGVYDDGIALNTTLNSSGSLEISSGGIAQNTTLNSGVELRVFSGGTANIGTFNGGHFWVLSGGTANGIAVNTSQGFQIDSGATANNTIVNSGGTVSVRSGVILNGTTVNSGGLLWVPSGTASSTTVNSGGSMIVDDGSVNSLVVSSGGGFSFKFGGRLTGHVTAEKDSYLFLDPNTVFDFDLTQTSAGAPALVNGFSRITGNAFYTLTVGMDQPTGIYQLARNVYEFDKTISVVNTSGTTIGPLSIGQSVNVGNVSYSLSLIDSSLFLSIREPGVDTIAPAVFSVTQSHDNPTLWPVTVTAEFADDVALKSALYRIGEDGAWTDYVGGVTLTENATVYFKAVDTSGNESEIVSHTVTNIEKNAHDPVYVYLDFDGEQTFYNNYDLDLSLSVTVADPGYSDSMKRIIQSELTELYAENGIVFTLTRPENAEYSTLYFGKSNAFADYGVYFGISETLDKCNRIGNDNAFVLLDASYSIAQIISVAETALDHIWGFAYSNKDELELRDYAVNSYLLSTQWSQNAPYNKYCPGDQETGEHCVTGCVATADAQLIYYWIENGMLELFLALNADDVASAHYEKDEGVIIDADPLTAAENGYLSFAETNELLSNFKPDDMDSIAALCFAMGIVNNALYAMTGTLVFSSQIGRIESIIRSGLHSMSPSNDCFIDSKNPDTGREQSFLSDNGRETLIRYLLAGHPVLASIPQHAIVIDGYNSATDQFHVNVGGGGAGNGWYSLNTAFYDDPNYEWFTDINYLYGDFMPNVYPCLSVADLSFEKDAVKQGKDIVVDVSMCNSGKVKSSEAMAYVYAGDKLMSSQVLDFLYPGEPRVFSLTVDSSGLPLGENAITVKVDSPDSEEVLSASQTIEVLENVVLNVRFFTGDFNGDLADTLAVQSGSTVTIYQNGEAWGLGLTLDPGWSVVGTGDFNADGLDDFLRVNTEGYVVGEMSNGNGTFTPQVLNLKNADWDILGTGNFDGVGPDDVLIANPTAASETVGLLGYWKGGTEWTLINGYSPEWTMVSTGDFNGDGKCDMLWKNEFIGDGGLTYNAYCTWIVENAVDWRMVSVANPDEWNFLCSGDFDGNGSHDIAMINNVGVVGIWGVNDGYLSSWSILSAVTSEWQLAGVADFNADGTDDIAWSNTATGLTGYWQINNKELTTWANIATIS